MAENVQTKKQPINSASKAISGITCAFWLVAQIALFGSFLYGLTTFGGKRVSVFTFINNIIDLFSVNRAVIYYYLASCAYGLCFLIIGIMMIKNLIQGIIYISSKTATTRLLGTSETFGNTYKLSVIYVLLTAMIWETEISSLATTVLFGGMIVFFIGRILKEFSEPKLPTFAYVASKIIYLIAQCVILWMLGSLLFGEGAVIADVKNGITILFGYINWSAGKVLVIMLFEYLAYPLIMAIIVLLYFGVVGDVLSDYNSEYRTSWISLMTTAIVLIVIDCLIYVGLEVASSVTVADKLLGYYENSKGNLLSIVLLTIAGACTLAFPEYVRYTKVETPPAPAPKPVPVRRPQPVPQPVQPQIIQPIVIQTGTQPVVLPNGQQIYTPMGQPYTNVIQPVSQQPQQPLEQIEVKPLPESIEVVESAPVQPAPQPIMAQPTPQQAQQPVVEPMAQPMPTQPVYQQPVQPQYQQPAQPVYQQPMYQQPVEQPIYQQPMYQQPVYQQPMYQQPVEQPAYQQPMYQQPVEQPAYQQPMYQQPVEQPVYQQPMYQQPVEQPAYQQPMYQQPVEQPVYQQDPMIGYPPVVAPVVENPAQEIVAAEASAEETTEIPAEIPVMEETAVDAATEAPESEEIPVEAPVESEEFAAEETVTEESKEAAEVEMLETEANEIAAESEESVEETEVEATEEEAELDETPAEEIPAESQEVSAEDESEE